jgi:hypothetical protein
MTARTKLALVQATLSAACLALVFLYTVDAEASEISRGAVTGPLYRMCDSGSWLLLLAVLASLIRPRIGAAPSILGAVLCLPVYLYAFLPGVFRLIFPGEYSVPLSSNIVLDPWTIVGIVVLCANIGWSMRVCFLGEKLHLSRDQHTSET